MCKAACKSVGLMCVMICSFIFTDAGVRATYDVDALNHQLDEILLKEGLAGITWMTIDDVSRASVGAAGYKDYPNRIAMGFDTKVHVGSITKVLLATGVLRLVSEGKIDLSAPVSRYLTETMFSNPWRETNPVTVRHLLDHTSGMEDARFWQLFSEKVTSKTPLMQAFPPGAGLLDIRVKPGTRFSYSNMGYTLLAAVIEAVTGSAYEAYLDEHLLTKLGMHDSTFEFTSQVGDGFDENLAWGHVDGGVSFAAIPIYLRPAGQFTTTAHDLAQFAKFLMSDVMLDGITFINTDLMRARGAPFGTDAALGGLGASYTLGLGRRDRNGVISFCHAGNIVGFSAMFCVYPDEGKAFAYSVNTDSEVADYGQIEKLFTEAVSPSPAIAPVTTEVMPTDLKEWDGFYTPSPKRFESFAYLDELFGFVALEQVSGGIRYAPLQGTEQFLRPTGGYLFSSDQRATNSHILLKDDMGNRVISTGFQSYQRVNTLYLLALWISLIAGVSGLLWFLVGGFIILFKPSASLSKHSIFYPFVGVLLLGVPVPLFLMQDFTALGDKTAASISLALVTLLLPVTMGFGLWRAHKRFTKSKVGVQLVLAALFVIQWCGVLAYWGMLPFRLWV